MMQIPSILGTVTTKEAWPTRRSELLTLFEEQVYGKTPNISFDAVNYKKIQSFSLQNDITCDRFIGYFEQGNTSITLGFTIYSPTNATKPVPCAMMINPFGKNPVVKAGTERTYHQLPFDKIVAEGYAAIMIESDDLGVDDAAIFANGLLRFAPRKNGDDWGAIGVWAWSVSRVIDYLEADDRFDTKKIAVAGCSRAGKTALWAGAQDERISIIISNVSGCSGAAITRGKTGEHIKDLTTQFPHWMCENYASYANHEEDLPIDQHMLLALCAPRPLYVCSATEDSWADPSKEYESCVFASEVYQLLGKQGFVSDGFPEADVSQMDGDIGYHVRTGEHGCRASDWEWFLKFIGKYFK